MRNATLIIGLVGSMIAIGNALAQPSEGRQQVPPQDRSASPQALCPPDVRGSNPPTVGGPPSQNLSEKLDESKGIICPPAGVDPEIQILPPAGGSLKIIPPPGAPGGRPDVQPK